MISEEERSAWSAEELEQAHRCAKRLLGTPALPPGQYVYVHAFEDLDVGDLVTSDVAGNAKKLIGAGPFAGIAISAISKGCHGWMQIMS